MPGIDDAPAPAGAGSLDFFLDFEPPESDFRTDVLEGLSRSEKAIPPKYYYDERGSQLFEDICATPEYYVTRTEIGILTEHARDIAELAGPRAAVVELGAGAAVKIRTLLDALESPELYLALDISGDFVVAATTALAAHYPDMRMGAAHADFTHAFTLPDDIYGDAERRLVFFPGSTIGNFEPPEALEILQAAHDAIRTGDLLVIGVDLKKDRAVLEAAYDDAGGVTAAFNHNLLARMNRELGGDLDPNRFDYRARWNPDLGRVEMHLVARTAHTFSVAGQAFSMRAGEAIHMENSHKYEIAEFQALAAQAKFTPVKAWTNEKNWFAVLVFQAI